MKLNVHVASLGLIIEYDTCYHVMQVYEVITLILWAKSYNLYVEMLHYATWEPSYPLCQLAYEVITLIWWYMRVTSHHSMSFVTMIRLCAKFGFMHVLRLKNVTCKLMNTFVPHLPPWLTCGLISIFVMPLPSLFF